MPSSPFMFVITPVLSIGVSTKSERQCLGFGVDFGTTRATLHPRHAYAFGLDVRMLNHVSALMNSPQDSLLFRF